jgi:hypothetical protein
MDVRTWMISMSADAFYAVRRWSSYIRLTVDNRIVSLSISHRALCTRCPLSIFLAATDDRETEKKTPFLLHISTSENMVHSSSSTWKTQSEEKREKENLCVVGGVERYTKHTRLLGDMIEGSGPHLFPCIYSHRYTMRKDSGRGPAWSDPSNAFFSLFIHSI